MAASTPSRHLELPIRRARVELVEETRGWAAVDGWLVTIIAGLCAFGLVMVYSASEVLGYLQTGNANYFFEKQIVGLGVGLVGMFVAMRIDYHRYQRWARPVGLLTVAMLLLVLVPHIGADRYGARRWFTVGPISLQPSAVAVVVVIVVLSRWLSDRSAMVRSWRGVRDYVILLAVPIILILMERDLGSTIVVAGIGITLLYLGGVRKHHLVLVLGCLVAVGWMMVKLEPYRIARLTAFGDAAFKDPLGTGLQSVQALYALGTGGITGVGLGNSIQKYSWLPEAHTDFIFAIIGEELGLIGTLSVVAAFTFLAWRGIRASLRAPDSFGALLAGGVTAWICIQAFINVGAVSGLIPTTGIPLPFISYGGTSLAMTLVAMGILCNVSAQGRRPGVLRRAHVDRRGRNGGAPDPSSGGRRRVARR